MQFNRVAVLDVGRPGEQGVRIEGLRMAFEISKSDKPTANTAQVSIWNLSDTTRSKLESLENQIILWAGYSEDVIKVLTVADIGSYNTTYEENGDKVTTLICADGGRALRDTRISLSYESGVAASDIVNDISNALGLDSVDILADLTGSYRRGYSFTGLAKDSLNELASRFDFDWSIQNAELKILPRREADTRDVVVLSPQSGLIGSPKSADDNKTNSSINLQQPGLIVECQLQPRIYPGSVIELQSREHNGVYRVETVTHTGDTRGLDWKSTLEVRKYDV